MNDSIKIKTPKDVTDFEREQLRFFLTRDDLALVLAKLNPSLAWLPLLAELKIINADTQLAMWIERNFADTDAVRDVVANIHFFRSDTADLLEFRFNKHAPQLPPLLAKSWRLILRHMRASRQGALRSEWFDLEPRIKRGEHTTEVLEMLADALKPKPVISKRFSLNGGKDTPEHPSDLMSIDFEIEEDVSEDEVLSAWPGSSPAEIDEKLLRLLTNALSSAVEDAIDAEVESNTGYGATDSDVPSVAKHGQNEFRKGFLPIVRVIADIWTRLAKKDPVVASSFVRLWGASPLRLVRRLALFAASNAIVTPEYVSQLLLTLPAGEIFLTSSSVEAYRLIHARWRDLSPDEQRAVEARICEGPPRDWFVDGAEKDRLVDRCRFDLLGDMQRTGLALSHTGESLLQEMRSRYPDWDLKPPEQAGFQIWHEGAREIVGNSAKLDGVPDDELIREAKKIAIQADFMSGDAWQALCQSDPDRALRGLEFEATTKEWEPWGWRTFLWAAKNIQAADAPSRIAKLLLRFPKARLAESEMANAASWWLDEMAAALPDTVLWSLWDRIEETAPRDETASMNDALTSAINAPGGRLAEVLVKKLANRERNADPDEAGQARLDRLIAAPGQFGALARVRLAAEISLLFERAPKWTTERIVPLFHWDSPDAAAAWTARKYSNYIGSPELFGLTKKPFLELFARSDVPEDEIRTFSAWLATIMIANQYGEVSYPITSIEARSALRVAGVRSLTSVAHRLAVEMETAKPNEKSARWHDIVSPVFQKIWPLDIELQSAQTTFKLVQILRATGPAFPDAADVIIPFIRPDDPRRHSTVFSISRADDELYSSSPEKMLELLVTVVGDPPARSVYALDVALSRVKSHAAQLADSPKFQRLSNLARPE